MILIDSSIWIEFFRKSGAPNSKAKVQSLLRDGEGAYACPTYFELLVGAREGEVNYIKEILSSVHREIFRPHHWESAAELMKRLRKKGYTLARGDIFLSAVALETGWPILCADRHFDTIRDEGDSRLQVIQMAGE